MIYVKRLKGDNQLIKIEKGQRVKIGSTDIEITKREYTGLNNALLIFQGGIDKSSFHDPADWGID